MGRRNYIGTSLEYGIATLKDLRKYECSLLHVPTMNSSSSKIYSSLIRFLHNNFTEDEAYDLILEIGSHKVIKTLLGYEDLPRAWRRAFTVAARLFRNSEVSELETLGFASKLACDSAGGTFSLLNPTDPILGGVIINSGRLGNGIDKTVEFLLRMKLITIYRHASLISSLFFTRGNINDLINIVSEEYDRVKNNTSISPLHKLKSRITNNSLVSVGGYIDTGTTDYDNFLSTILLKGKVDFCTKNNTILIRRDKLIKKRTLLSIARYLRSSDHLLKYSIYIYKIGRTLLIEFKSAKGVLDTMVFSGSSSYRYEIITDLNTGSIVTRLARV